MGKGGLRIIVLYCFVYMGIVSYGQINYSTDGNKVSSLEKSGKEKSEPLEVKKVNFDEDRYQRDPEYNEKEAYLAEIARKDTIINILLVGLVLLLIALFFFYWKYRVRKKSSDVLKEKK